MTMTGGTGREATALDRNMVWALLLGIGAGAILLVLQFTPRPFLATIAAILWLVALIGVAALIQIRQSQTASHRTGRLAWRIAGLAYIVGAAFLIADPLLGKGGMAAALAVSLAAAGLARVSFALGEEQNCRICYFLSGLMTLSVAMAIGFAWPFALIAPAIKLLAADLLVLGVTFFVAHARRPDNGAAST